MVSPLSEGALHKIRIVLVFSRGQFLIYAAFCILPPSVKASLVLCSWFTWMPDPQGEANSFRNDLSCHPREDKVAGQYAAV